MPENNYFTFAIDKVKRCVVLSESGESMEINFEYFKDFSNCVKNAQFELEKILKEKTKMRGVQDE